MTSIEALPWRDYLTFAAAVIGAVLGIMNFMRMVELAGRGQRTLKDAKKAADLYLQARNHVIACCWAPVARHLLAQRSEKNQAAVMRVATAVTSWVTALGDKEAAALQAELVSQGVLTMTEPIPAAAFNDLSPWMRETGESVGQ
jgi:hypothetical protein